MRLMKLPPQATESKQEKPTGMMTQMKALLAEKDDLIDQKSEVIAQQKKRIELLESYLRLVNQKRYDASSEQTPPDQGELFNEAEATAEPEQDELPLEETEPKPKAKKGRKSFSDNIPRIQHFSYLSETDKAYAIDTFFVKFREELDIIPAQVQVIEYIQEKAVFPSKDGGQRIVAAQMPQHPVPKAMGSVNLMTYIIISKYADGLPLYRQEKILHSRYGGDITRATMANWVIALARQAQPLIHLLRDYQHSGPVINMDETTIQVLKEKTVKPLAKSMCGSALAASPVNTVCCLIAILHVAGRSPCAGLTDIAMVTMVMPATTKSAHRTS